MDRLNWIGFLHHCGLGGLVSLVVLQDAKRPKSDSPLRLAADHLAYSLMASVAYVLAVVSTVNDASYPPNLRECPPCVATRGLPVGTCCTANAPILQVSGGHLACVLLVFGPCIVTFALYYQCFVPHVQTLPSLTGPSLRIWTFLKKEDHCLMPVFAAMIMMCIYFLLTFLNFPTFVVYSMSLI